MGWRQSVGSKAGHAAGLRLSLGGIVSSRGSAATATASGPETVARPRSLLEEREPFDGVFAEASSVVAAVGERLTCNLGVAIQQDAAIEGLIQPLVGIERDRVRLIKTLESVR